jgi:hypothetical protein
MEKPPLGEKIYGGNPPGSSSLQYHIRRGFVNVFSVENRPISCRKTAVYLVPIIRLHLPDFVSLYLTAQPDFSIWYTDTPKIAENTELFYFRIRVIGSFQCPRPAAAEPGRAAP